MANQIGKIYICAACNAERYALLGHVGPHASCEDNLRAVLLALGHDRIDVPQPVNLFENNPIRADGSLGIEPALSAAGDAVTLRAELDATIVVSACPQDITCLNGGTPSRILLETL